MQSKIAEGDVCPRCNSEDVSMQSNVSEVEVFECNTCGQSFKIHYNLESPIVTWEEEYTNE